MSLPPDLNNLYITEVITSNDESQPAIVCDTRLAVHDYRVKKWGAFTDIYYAETITEAWNVTIPKHIAVKRVRFHPMDTLARHRIISTLTVAEEMCSSLSHPNICPMWSLTSSTEPTPAVAMPWFNNGNVVDFIRQNPAIDKLAIVKQFASGVAYIHSMGKVHGNIVPWNVMITGDGRACLSDVGLNVRLIRVLCGDRRCCPSDWIFKAPEELSFDWDPDSFVPTAQMDVYAFATTAYIRKTQNVLMFS